MCELQQGGQIELLAAQVQRVAAHLYLLHLVTVFTVTLSLAAERDPPIDVSARAQTLEGGRHGLKGTLILVGGIFHEGLIIIGFTRWSLTFAEEPGEE